MNPKSGCETNKIQVADIVERNWNFIAEVMTQTTSSDLKKLVNKYADIEERLSKVEKKTILEHHKACSKIREKIGI